MKILSSKTFALKTTEDIARLRQQVLSQLKDHGFNLLAQTKMMTATSELARNMVVHAQGGEVKIEILVYGNKRGLRLIFADEGPGISDVDKAMENGYSTGSGLGLGLGGSKRLVDEFVITSQVGRGTCVTITKWRYDT